MDQTSNNKIYKQCNACGHIDTIQKDSHKLAKLMLQSRNTDWDDNFLSSVIKLDSESNSMTQSKDLNKQIHDPYEQFNSLLKVSSIFNSLQQMLFFLYVQKKKLANQLNDPVSIQEFITETERLNIVEKAPFYVAKCLFTDQIIKDIGVYRMLLYQVSFQFNPCLVSIFFKTSTS